MISHVIPCYLWLILFWFLRFLYHCLVMINFLFILQTQLIFIFMIRYCGVLCNLVYHKPIFPLRAFLSNLRRLLRTWLVSVLLLWSCLCLIITIFSSFLLIIIRICLLLKFKFFWFRFEFRVFKLIIRRFYSFFIISFAINNNLFNITFNIFFLSVKTNLSFLVICNVKVRW